MKHEYERLPYLVAFQNNSGVRDVYGGLAEITVLESYLLKPKDTPSDTVLMFMHPIGGGAYLPMINALARAGHHVIYCNSRFRGTDSALLMEKVIEDLGAAIKDAKDRLAYRKVVLAGWSGGGSLSVFYQQQAQHATVTSRPSGDGPDLTKLDLPAADGIMLLAAHISRHGTLTEWLDGSISRRIRSDQTRPGPGPLQPGQPRPAALQRRVPGSLPAGPDRPQPPNHRLGQGKVSPTGRSGPPRRRVRLHRARHHGRPAVARPGCRSQRTGSGNLLFGRSSRGEHEPGRPGAVLHAAQLALAMELRRRTRRRGGMRARHRGAGAGDRQSRRRRVHHPSTPAVFSEAIGHPDKEMHEIQGATHYYAGPDQRDKLRAAVTVVTDWLERHKFTGTA